jgi:hypothetical protein
MGWVRHVAHMGEMINKRDVQKVRHNVPQQQCMKDYKQVLLTHTCVDVRASFQHNHRPC